MFIARFYCKRTFAHSQIGGFRLKENVDIRSWKKRLTYIVVFLLLCARNMYDTKNHFFFFPLMVFCAGTYKLCKKLAAGFDEEIKQVQSGRTNDFLYEVVTCGFVIAFFIACLICGLKWDFRFEVNVPTSFFSHLGSAMMVIPLGVYTFILPCFALVPICAFFAWLFKTDVKKIRLSLQLFCLLACVLTLGHLCGIIDLMQILQLIGSGIQWIKNI